jgi:DNA-binding CsgD family transcriptional regulator
VQACIDATEHRPDAARHAYEIALSCLDGLGMPYEEALARLDYGRFLRHLGQRRAALRELCAARVTFAALGAIPFVRRCDAELGYAAPAGAASSRAPAQRVPSEGRLAPLTARQLAVARAVAAGKSNEQIARDLYITVKTVEYHVSQIFTRLGIDGRAEIAAALSAPKS